MTAGWDSISTCGPFGLEAAEVTATEVGKLVLERRSYRTSSGTESNVVVLGALLPLLMVVPAEAQVPG